MKKYEFDLLMTSEDFKKNQKRIMEELERQEEENKEQLRLLEKRDFIHKVMLLCLGLLAIVLCFHFLADIQRDEKLNAYEKCNGEIKEVVDPYTYEKAYVCK